MPSQRCKVLATAICRSKTDVPRRDAIQLVSGLVVRNTSFTHILCSILRTKSHIRTRELLKTTALTPSCAESARAPSAWKSWTPMLRGAQRCSSLLTRQLAGKSAVLTQSQILPASLVPLAVFRSTVVAEGAPAGAGPSSTAFHSFPSQNFHTSAPWWQKPAPLDDEDDAHLKEHAIHKEAGTPSGDEKSKKFDKGFISPHRGSASGEDEGDMSYLMMHPVYTTEYAESVKPKHKIPEKFHEKTGLWAVTAMRSSFDFITRYGPGRMDECKWLERFVFLETVAGVPGMVGGMMRHMRSLRSMRRDNGWIHTLLEEAENERMHLLTFLELKQPGPMFRAFVLLTQGIFFNLYFMFYLLSPKHCHAFVGYLEEEAVKTYTHCLEDIDAGRLPEWKDKKIPDIARVYWKMKKDATMRDLIMNVRADEACHSHVNHTFAAMTGYEHNPFVKGNHMIA